MPVITLPDGSRREFESALTVLAVAESIGAGLAKAAIAGRVNGVVVDLSFLLEADAELAIITTRDAEALDIVRHSTAHLLAQAVKQLYPSAQVTIGPVIDDGFYYDFAYERAFTPEDLAAIEVRMKELCAAAAPVSRSVMAREDAVRFFTEKGEHYKAEIIGSIPGDEPVSLYTQGDFTDLCRGPHVPDTGKLKTFRLMKIAGAYWRGDARNAMLQRIYGTAWLKKEDLDAYLKRLEEAEKRDHRRLGREMDLFHFQEEAPGSVFWHPKGWTLFQTLIGYLRHAQKKAGYVEVNTPDVMDRSLWETSGHWHNFRDHMFTTQTEDERVFALKPMNCPGGVVLYRHGLKSYRDLPLRMAEFGKVHRYEPSGALHGLMRVRHFTQDDAHVFCTLDQLQDESRDVVSLVLGIYRDFGFSEVSIKLSTRPENRIGDDAIWDQLESVLAKTLDGLGLAYTINEGEGAFYGPKLEFVLRDAVGRDWQCGTLQVDLNLPERFDLNYVCPEGNKLRPVMLHRAIFGSLERFIGILTEHYAGHYPFWLAPVQAVIMNITDRQAGYVHEIQQFLDDHGFRVVSDLRNEKIGFKIREHSLQRIPYQIILGDKEAETRTVTLRAQNGTDLGAFPLEQLLQRFREESMFQTHQ